MNTADVAAITTHGRQPPRRNRSRMTTQMPLRQMIQHASAPTAAPTAPSTSPPSK